ncbi:oxidoreductase [Arcanobacterium phocisimile]|uniref:Oxidoreductase n=1 Tax=Arcanobacterium phocisimile TaxID=1302235 RepID=A0ABX7IJD9_9ACTO|nr:oxidoreductase [Arcanobacterium phocisimile]QRV02850.1 oxidoreductase [Arcanobacterium phocisimile]
MVWFFGKSARSAAKQARGETFAYLSDFVRTRQGVEAYFEEATPRNPTSIVLVAYDGEWTRRKVPDLSAAKELCEQLAVPLYDVAQTGYPRSMREWTVKNPGSNRR